MLGVVLVRVLTCSQKRAEVVDEDEISFTAECSVKVIQVQSPDESPSKSVVLQVSDLDTTTSPFQRGAFVTLDVRWAAESTETLRESPLCHSWLCCRIPPTGSA